MRELKIGRLPSNDIIVNDNSVSREHATLIISDNEYTVRDLNSSNGTYVNGMRINGVSKLRRNDILKVGSSLVPWMNYLSMNGIDYKTNVSQPTSSQVESPTPSRPKYEYQMPLPNSGTTLALGIIGLILSLALIGIILNIITLAISSSAIDRYNSDPLRYTASSFSQVKTGRVLATIGLCLFGFVLLVYLGSV